MKIGDVEVSIWRDGLKVAYCLCIGSERRSPKSKQVSYWWQIETWTDERLMQSSKTEAAKTYAEAFKKAMRLSDKWERGAINERKREAINKRKGKKS